MSQFCIYDTSNEQVVYGPVSWESRNHISTFLARNYNIPVILPEDPMLYSEGNVLILEYIKDSSSTPRTKTLTARTITPIIENNTIVRIQEVNIYTDISIENVIKTLVDEDKAMANEMIEHIIPTWKVVREVTGGPTINQEDKTKAQNIRDAQNIREMWYAERTIEELGTPDLLTIGLPPWGLPVNA